ncbi:MAG: hypothetical protein GJ671_03875 [Alteromonadaceae bacterium]|nr:hypothetical protein [Alteromonadaceae bacterium]
MHHIFSMNFDLHFFGARFWCVRNDDQTWGLISHIEPFAFSCFYTRMRQELADFSIINIDILPEPSGHNASRMLFKPKVSSVGWFVLGSLVTHLIIMAGVAQQHWSVPVDVKGDQPAIQAELIEIPLPPKVAAEPAPKNVHPVTTNPIPEPVIEPVVKKAIEPEIAQPLESLVPRPLPTTPTLLPAEMLSTAMPPNPVVDLPAVDFRSQTPIVLQESFNTNTLLSSTSILPQATRDYLQNNQASELAELSSNTSGQYQIDLISPELFKAPEPLTKEALAMKTIMQSKIDIDCASALNQALVIVSAFTVGALLCEDKGDVNSFIEQRLAEKRPSPPVIGSERLKALAASAPTSPKRTPG